MITKNNYSKNTKKSLNMCFNIFCLKSKIIILLCPIVLKILILKIIKFFYC